MKAFSENSEASICPVAFWRRSEPVSSGHKAVLGQHALPLLAEYKLNPLLRQVRICGLFCDGYRIGSRDVQVLWYLYDLDLGLDIRRYVRCVHERGVSFPQSHPV